MGLWSFHRRAVESILRNILFLLLVSIVISSMNQYYCMIGVDRSQVQKKEASFLGLISFYLFDLVLKSHSSS